jgi:hypothetical protein
MKDLDDGPDGLNDAVFERMLGGGRKRAPIRRTTPKVTKTYDAFCRLWLSFGPCATVDANRRVSAAGYHATMAHFAATGASDPRVR